MVSILSYSVLYGKYLQKHFSYQMASNNGIENSIYDTYVALKIIQKIRQNEVKTV